MDRGDGLGAESFAMKIQGPSCPVEVVRRSLDGLVVIAIDVNPRGRVERTEVLNSPNNLLSEAALGSMIVVHNLTSLGVKGTPRLVLRDESGIVQGMWEGLLPPTTEHAVLARIGNGKHILETPHFEEIISFKATTSNNDKLDSSIPSREFAGLSRKIDEGDLRTIGIDHTVSLSRIRFCVGP
jgi:hypothetical protein